MKGMLEELVHEMKVEWYANWVGVMTHIIADIKERHSDPLKISKIYYLAQGYLPKGNVA